MVVLTQKETVQKGQLYIDEKTMTPFVEKAISSFLSFKLLLHCQQYFFLADRDHRSNDFT